MQQNIGLSKILKSQSTSTCSFQKPHSSSSQFIPFVQERDSIGRLLKKNKIRKSNYFADQFSLSNSYHFNDAKEKQIEGPTQKIEKVIQIFFEKIEIEQREKKRKKARHHPIKLLSKSNQISQKQTISPKKNIKQQRTRLKRIKSQQATIISILNSEESPTIKLEMKRIQSLNIPLKQPPQTNKSQKKKYDMRFVGQQQITKKKNLISSTQLKDTFQNPELERHMKLNILSLKLFPDYEQSHNKFLKKMDKSIQLAHRIKRQLQND